MVAIATIIMVKNFQSRYGQKTVAYKPAKEILF